MNPAQTLTAAATRLREAAQDAIHEDRPVWRLGNTLGTKTKVVLDDPDKPSVLIETYAARLERVNRYLTMVGPNVGLAVADWLEAASQDSMHGHFDSCSPTTCVQTAALAVARQILGEVAE